ncbi:hypothetical protein EV356DRAFT_458255, partial [Viridothelium virens]
HSWVKVGRAVNKVGNWLNKPGYPRGYVNYNLPTFLAINNTTITYMLPPTGCNILWSSDLVCKNTQQ